ncbi:MAG: DUF4920 domain-containing protein [Chitinophagales bacterium]
MKKILQFFIICCISLSIISCNNTKKATTQDANQFGEKIGINNAFTVNELTEKMAGKAKMNAKVEGEVTAVCQKKGCWMMLKQDYGDDMRVTFKDYGFFMPLDISGKTIVAEGQAVADTTSVDMLRHYAEDEGLPQAEIEKITEPKIEISFVANGVVIK